MQDSTCPALLGCRTEVWTVFAYAPITLFGGPFHATSANCQIGNFHVSGPTTPISKLTGLGFSAFARRYWRNHYCFLFLQVLRWFTSLGSLFSAYFIQLKVIDWINRVAPFGNLRVNGCLHLTEAYRSLPRPSSPSCAKASTVCP